MRYVCVHIFEKEAGCFANAFRGSSAVARRHHKQGRQTHAGGFCSKDDLFRHGSAPGPPPYFDPAACLRWLSRDNNSVWLTVNNLIHREHSSEPILRIMTDRARQAEALGPDPRQATQANFPVAPFAADKSCREASNLGRLSQRPPRISDWQLESLH